MSYRQQLSWLLNYRERKNRERLLFKLDLAEAFNYAYTGSQPPGKKNAIPKGAQAYKRWRRKLIREIYPNVKSYNIWNLIDDKKKSIKIN